MQITALSGNFATFGYIGPNQAAVQADNARAIAGGLNGGGFSIADILSDNDKALTGYQPNSGKINQTALALANYRYTGAVKGEVSSEFVAALKSSIESTGGYPANPDALVPVATQNSLLSSNTLNTLLSFNNQQSS